MSTASGYLVFIGVFAPIVRRCPLSPARFGGKVSRFFPDLASERRQGAALVRSSSRRDAKLLVIVTVYEVE
jgi:hypothetical protein